VPSTQPAARKPVETKVFVAPRAPDDPGPEATGTGDDFSPYATKA
jgi:hypothetical protein